LHDDLVVPVARFLAADFGHAGWHSMIARPHARMRQVAY
jgi:hypothetical protein